VYIQGVRDTIDLMQYGTQRCIPQSVNLRQLQDVAVRYLKQHPETRHFNAVVLIAAAIREAWCPDLISGPPAKKPAPFDTE
jgi:hypothetical protein